jgi:hypothetical protein
MASSVFIGWETPAGRTALKFEMCVSRTLAGTATATKHRVEKGAAVTDHIRAEGRKLNLDVMVSDSPLVALNGIRFSTESREPPEPYDAGAANGPPYLTTTGPTELPAAVRAVYSQLDTLRAAGQIVEVFCPEYYYTDMYIASVSAKRDKGTGGAISISLALEQLRFVETSITNAPKPSVTERRAQPKKPQGKKDPSESEADNARGKQSAAAFLRDALAKRGVNIFGGT